MEAQRGVPQRLQRQGRNIHLSRVDLPTPRPPAMRVRDSPRLNAILTASRLQLSVCFMVSLVS